MIKTPVYDKSYYEKSNYKNYNGIHYSMYLCTRFFLLGLFYKLFLRVNTIVDVGCANGRSVWVFRKLLRMEAYGIDISEYAISKSPKSIRKYLFNTEITNLEVLPIKKLDLLVSYDTFEHLSEDELELFFSKLKKYTDKGILGIYVLDELIARIHNLIGFVHRDHLSEHTSSWWLDKLNGWGWAATKIPGSRKGSILIRLKEK